MASSTAEAADEIVSVAVGGVGFVIGVGGAAVFVHCDIWFVGDEFFEMCIYYLESRWVPG